jgi:Pseudomonas avirulence D protein (AvrD)
VRHTFDEVVGTVRASGDTRMATRVRIEYPADWSTKREGTILPPHLSTVDAILLGVQMTELCLVQAFGLGPGDRRRSRVRAIKVRAGVAPEEELSSLVVTIRLLGTAAGPRGQTITTIETTIGSMRVRCEAEHPDRELRTGMVRHLDVTDVLGPPDGRYYGTGYTRRGHRMDDLAVDAVSRAATARVTIGGTFEGVNAGIEGAYQPTVTAVDCFVTTLQLGQILLYELDSMRRSASHTLWMRSTSIELLGPSEPTERMPLVVSLRNTTTITMRQRLWRTADITAELGAVRCTCAVAHQLPDTRN